MAEKYQDRLQRHRDKALAIDKELLKLDKKIAKLHVESTAAWDIYYDTKENLK